MKGSRRKFLLLFVRWILSELQKNLVLVRLKVKRNLPYYKSENVMRLKEQP